MLSLSLVARTLRVTEKVSLTIERKPEGVFVAVNPINGEAPTHLSEELKAIRLALARPVFFSCSLDELDTTFVSLLAESTDVRIRSAVSYESQLATMKADAEAAERSAAKPKAGSATKPHAAPTPEEGEEEEEQDGPADGTSTATTATATPPTGDIDLFGT